MDEINNNKLMIIKFLQLVVAAKSQIAFVAGKRCRRRRFLVMHGLLVCFQGTLHFESHPTLRIITEKRSLVAVGRLIGDQLALPPECHLTQSAGKWQFDVRMAVLVTFQIALVRKHFIALVTRENLC